MLLRRYGLLLIISFSALACSYLVQLSPSPIPASATATLSPIPSATLIPPTDTPTPTPTPLSGIWLDDRTFEIIVQHPQSTSQPDWKSYNEITIPVNAYVGGVVFMVEEINGRWGGAQSRSVPVEESVMPAGSTHDLALGGYCVADYFMGYKPEEICASIAPGYQLLQWIRPYFAGYKTEVGVAFTVGDCNPATCSAYLKVGKIQLILYQPE
jgi:hypothetical protein